MSMANRVPVIATRRAGLPEHLGDAAVWVGDNQPAELAERIIALLADEPARAKLAAAGRARAEQFFSWDKIAEKTLASYRAALARRAAAA
jgi:alpha-1,3-rhamnosyl/mannosyltransferase